MNKLTKKILAAAAAAVMTVTAVPAVSPSVYANVAYDTVADGWVTEGGVKRRYIDGFPYTGWLFVEDGTQKYCLDGYLVTGSFTIDGKTYSFGKDGTLTGKGTVPDFSAECGAVDPDTRKIEFTVFANKDNGKEYSIGNPEKMQRWVKGKWVDCIGKNTKYAVDDSAAIFSYDRSNRVSFYPQAYTNNSFTSGTYRMVFSAREMYNSKASAKKFYTVFTVSPKNFYKNGWVTEGSMERRYKNGVPYTGWMTVNGIKRKYCLDGYLVKGELQIDNLIYTFDDEGICTGKTKAVLAAGCGVSGKVSANTERLDINIYLNVNNGDEYWAVDPGTVKRWEYGRWVDCRGYAKEYITDDCLADIKYSKSDAVHFYPQEYTRNNFKEGYYKINLAAHSFNSSKVEHFSTMFEVVPYEIVKNGWVKENGIERRYKNDVPYTGWVKSKEGIRKYCFDGYAVTGDFQIGKYIYSFGADGSYTGFRRKPVITASCGEVISSDTKTLVITVKNTGLDGRDYAVGDPYKMERWENGRWVDCAAAGVFLQTSDDAAVLSGASWGDEPVSVKMNFYPQNYTGYNFKPGYYRISLYAWDAGSSGFAWQSSRQDVYVMFEVV